ncbi:GDSL esterase/lipase At5g45910-like [Amborella trichopoda]|uniref:GDSL esterase/lipase At5g45910-like n=1 Tax=Amborella trichopoda TaxID=13333 RepID=UPI0009BDEAA5|nr:GDSL esterase/lipase At5g45910-like [Amborella trichopoda]|eukprot:XP_020528272.1 GDSL esterase/lipase At5g45910-like [Amborella trichopoda]
MLPHCSSPASLSHKALVFLSSFLWTPVVSSPASMNFSFFLIFSLLFNLYLSEAVAAHKNNYAALFSFGDSLADTGNLLLSGANMFPGKITDLPYGETTFKEATGRCSNGRLIVDFFAEALGLPLLPPYLSKTHRKKDFRKGVNFAVAGATALQKSYLDRMGILNFVTNQDFSLGVQLNWFEQLLPSLCDPLGDFLLDLALIECKKYMKKSLFLVGEIGGNDYNYAFIAAKRMDELKSLVPHVLKSTMHAVEVLIRKGAKNVVVPGNLPIGCLPIYLTLFKKFDRQQYDPQTGCLTYLNDFSIDHNSKLQESIKVMRQRFPHARIMYADYYNAAMRIFKKPESHGFTNETPLSACCGRGGHYNFNFINWCGHLGVPVCNDPSSHVSWDGIHLTEAAYKSMVQSLLCGGLTYPHIELPPSTCPK